MDAQPASGLKYEVAELFGGYLAIEISAKGVAGAERRASYRVTATVPVEVRKGGGVGTEEAHTRDLSATGVFLYTKSHMQEGSELELVMMLPPGFGSGEKAWVCCHARVLRVEKLPGNEFGVAAEIEKMDVLPELSA